MLAFPCLAATAPNVIIIYSDDHGYTDLGAYGIDKNVYTPNMDALARGGALMTSGYSSAPQCRPSRAGLLVGRIQNEFGFDQNHADAGAGEGTLPHVYPPGTDMAGQPLLTIADRMKKLGYVTGFSGKWHCGPNDDPNAKHDPRGRGFDEYWVGSMQTGSRNIDLQGRKIAHQKVSQWPEGIRNRVILQGKYAEAFITRNQRNPFFLYFPIFGPHVPLIEKNDPYYTTFPKLDYPQYNDEQDDVRRQGLALIKAMDDSVGAVVDTLRRLGLEEKTLILFAGDNGAPSKNAWNGSDNVPMRGQKGNLLEGGIRVPMFAYWKGAIQPGQVIDKMVTTLDFTATTLATGGGEIPPEFDGVNILPRLLGKAPKIARAQPMFWDFFGTEAIRQGDWKLWRNASGDRLFHIVADPSELYNVAAKHPERAARMAAALTTWRHSLLPTARSPLNWADEHWRESITGAPPKVQPDLRYRMRYDAPKPTPYPLPMTGEPVPHGIAPEDREAHRQSATSRAKPSKAERLERQKQRQQRLERLNKK
jgi:arylsulfatase A-like enzyme